MMDLSNVLTSVSIDKEILDEIKQAIIDKKKDIEEYLDAQDED